MFFPSVFVSHGAPSLLLEAEQPAHQFLRAFGAELGWPAAILVWTFSVCATSVRDWNG